MESEIDRDWDNSTDPIKVIRCKAESNAKTEKLVFKRLKINSDKPEVIEDFVKREKGQSIEDWVFMAGVNGAAIFTPPLMEQVGPECDFELLLASYQDGLQVYFKEMSAAYELQLRFEHVDAQECNSCATGGCKNLTGSISKFCEKCQKDIEHFAKRFFNAQLPPEKRVSDFS